MMFGIPDVGIFEQIDINDAFLLWQYKYSYLSNRRVYQLSMQGDIFGKKVKRVGKQPT